MSGVFMFRRFAFLFYEFRHPEQVLIPIFENLSQYLMVIKALIIFHFDLKDSVNTSIFGFPLISFSSSESSSPEESEVFESENREKK